MKNIYIADDDADDTLIFEQVIGDVSPQSIVTSASDGYDLFATLEKNVPPRPDMIFLDINMPKMNGHDTLDRIKKDDRYKNIPIIIYSTSAEKIDIENTFAAGADHYITKPADYGKLENLMKQALAINFDDGYKRTDIDNYELKA